MSRLLVVGPVGSDSRAITLAAAAAGMDVYAAVHHTDPQPVEAERVALRGTTVVDFAAPERTVSDLIAFCRRHRIDGVVTANEYLTPTVAAVCAELSLPGNDPRYATAARNKLAMAARFAQCGVSVPHTRIVRDEDALVDLVAGGGVRLPCVVKPAEGAGSLGVSVMTDARGARQAFRHARTALASAPYGIAADRRVLVQHYVEGTEWSVESVTRDGVTHHVCVTEKHTTAGVYRVDTGLGVPARIAPDQKHALLTEVTKAIGAVGIVNGVSHTEAKVADGRCTIIEIGARIAGGRIAALIELALGVNLWRCCVDVAVGTPPDLAPTRCGYAAIRFVTAPHPGRLVALEHLPSPGGEVREVRMLRRPGAEVAGPDSSRGRLAHLVVTGPDAHSTNLRADALVCQVKVVVAR
jgi:biotin carboxylase